MGVEYAINYGYGFKVPDGAFDKYIIADDNFEPDTWLDKETGNLPDVSYEPFGNAWSGDTGWVICIDSLTKSSYGYGASFNILGGSIPETSLTNLLLVADRLGVREDIEHGWFVAGYVF